MNPPDPNFSRAVLIGTSHYTEETAPDLPAVADNLTVLQEVFCDHETWGLPPQHCQVIDDPATNAALLDPVQAAAREATDTLLIYFAGHGMLDERNSLYLALTGSDPLLENRRYYTGVPFRSLAEIIVPSMVRRRIIILDCCFSGRAIQAVVGVDNALADVGGIYVMSSAAGNKTSKAPLGGEFTAFTGELLKVLRDGIPGHPKVLTLSAIFDRVLHAMEENGLPNPRALHSDAAGQLPFVRNKASRTAPRGYGQVPWTDVGRVFADRKELHDAGVHRPLQAGICGTWHAGGAESIVVSGGYKDDEDHGDVIIYTGHGGRDDNTQEQVADQDPRHPGNAALIASRISGLPVRVIRGARGDPGHSPPHGFSYDGLFTVEDYWWTIGTDGYRIIQFRLEYIEDSAATQASARPRVLAPNRWERVSRGLYLSRDVSEHVKAVHNYECQVCGFTIEAPGGIRVAETTHIRGLGIPHKGPDAAENILCLCPSHRRQFDLGAITIEDNLQVVDESTGVPFATLSLARRHRVGAEFLRYHRNVHRRTPSQAGQ